MNILITVSNDYLQHAKVMLYSLSKHEQNLCIYIFHNSFQETELKDFESFVQNECNGKFYPVCANQYFTNAPLSEEFSKPEVYYRLLAPYLLPKEIDRVLYLDADIIINKPISDFYYQNFDGNYVSVVLDRDVYGEQILIQKEKLGLKTSDGYFNSGVILFNLKAFRENIEFDSIFQFIQDKYDDLYYFDQDILNYFLKDNKKLCDKIYNYQIFPNDNVNLSELMERIPIFHYTDRPKPWKPEYSNILGQLYWSNASQLGYGLDTDHRVS